MRFLDLYEADETKPQDKKDIKPQTDKSAKGDKPEQSSSPQGGTTVTIDTIIGDLEKFHDDKTARINFLNKINRPGQQPDKAFTYGGNESGKGVGGKSISYTADVGSNQPSEDFKKILTKIKDGHPNWKKEIEEVIDKVNNSTRQQYIKNFFIPKIENPAIRLTTSGNMRGGDSRVPGTEQYRQFGQAMVFYSGKCVSKMMDTDTKIDPEKFKEIMQGCFGAALGNNREDDSFLQQFGDLESKMKIDAAKNVINSIHTAGTKDIAGADMEAESYYSGLSYIINNRLFEAEGDGESADGNGTACPKTIDEFSNDMATALKQAEQVAKTYPKQYKLWYEKLRGAFDSGVKEYQDLERNDRLAETGIRNPITGEIEKRNGKAWGAGGPNAFIRNNPDLQKLVDKIKSGTPGCEGVGGWDIFNCGPKLILTMFDALEKGGKIYQKLCDDIGEGMKQIKRSLKQTDFDKMMKSYADKKQHGRAMEVGLSSVLCALAEVYKILANGKIGQLNLTTKTFNTENSGNDTVIQVRVNELKNAVMKVVKEKVDYDKWKIEEDKKQAERIKQLETEIATLSKPGAETQSAEQQSGGDQLAEPKKNGISNVKSDSYVRPTLRSLILNEEDTQQNQSGQPDNNNQKKVADVKEELKKKKDELEKLKSGKNSKTLINIENYIAILDNYKKVLGLENYIKEAYSTINTLFDPDAAEAQYQAIFNGDEQNEDSEDSEETDTDGSEQSNTEEAKTQDIKDSLTLSQRLENILNEYLTEADDGLETSIEDEEEDDDDADSQSDEKTGDAGKTEEQQKKEPTAKSDNPGNLDWVNHGAAQGLKEIYRIFSEGKDDVRFDIPVFKELAQAKTEKEALKKVALVLDNLQKTLNRIKPVDPIVDGIVACNNIENPRDIAGCIECIGKVDSEEEKKSDSQDNKEDEKKGEEKSQEQKSTVDKLKEKRDTLLKFIDENSPLMKNIVGNLNNKVKAAKDDGWIKDYDAFVNEFNTEAGKIFEFLKELYGESETGKKWLDDRKAQIEKSNFIVKVWLIISMAKYAGSQLSAQIEKAEEDALKKEQQGGREKINSSFEIIQKLPTINEAAATKHTINVYVNTLKQSMEKVDFNNLLPTDFTNSIYDLEHSDTFNANETRFANALGLKNIQNGNGLYAIVSHLIMGDVNSNPILAKVKEDGINCQECIKQLTYAHTAKGNKESDDRNVYYIYGLMTAVAVSLDGIQDNELKETDMRSDVHTQKGDKDTGSTGDSAMDDAKTAANDGSAQGGENSAENKQDGTAQGNQPAAGQQAEQKNDSYIPEFSKDSLINEIYKYIKGN